MSISIEQPLRIHCTTDIIYIFIYRVHNVMNLNNNSGDSAADVIAHTAPSKITLLVLHAIYCMISNECDYN